MPRSYKKLAVGASSEGRGGYRIDKAESNFQKACDAIRNGELSVRQAAKQYGFSKSTLHDAVTRKHIKPSGGQTVLTSEEEDTVVENLLTLSQWGFPLDSFELRLLIKQYLDRRGVEVKRFKNNLPGCDWAKSFLKRHRNELSHRLSQNIKVARAKVTPTIIRSFFNNLENTLNNVPPENIINYDETNLSDDPGRKKVIVRRGCKYPERIMNSTKSSISIMFACTASGKLLPPYVVYKAKHIYDAWTEGGPSNTRYNRTESGWFDASTFHDWYFSVVLPYAKSRPGKKVIIGDNLSSHMSLSVVTACEKNISFVLLPPNSTHLTQPLDVSVFGPLKKHWRSVLTDFKATSLGRRTACLPKSEFPKQLSKLMEKLQKNVTKNIQSGFRKCGIHPLNAEEVLSRLPESETAQAPSTGTSSEADSNQSQDSTNNLTSPTRLPRISATTSGVTSPTTENAQIQPALNESLISMLSTFRYGPSTSTPTRGRKKKMAVSPGKSIRSNNLSTGTGRQCVSSDVSGDEVDDPNPALPQGNDRQPSTSKVDRPSKKKLAPKRQPVKPVSDNQPSTSKEDGPSSKKKKMSPERQPVRRVIPKIQGGITQGIIQVMEERDLTRATTTEGSSTEEAETEVLADESESEDESRGNVKLPRSVNRKSIASTSRQPNSIHPFKTLPD
ncbi:hypothetical protein Pmani_013354 [Petrolisthes manimaculis]|uniref:Uncharacterized protein n=1 Tax=Petrolisthes manimaculis TaxID=1843537 RepID=A0AAE1U9P6_9EUCA|nr:hypothetical protein Pmani_013354 [Petrolisthes manimaculis]